MTLQYSIFATTVQPIHILSVHNERGFGTMSEIAKVLKTEEEIREANRKEHEIQVAYEAENVAAQKAFNEATKDAWEEYEAIWKPAREQWEAVSGPHFKKLRARQAANEKTRGEAVGEIRRDWRLCPRCGTHAARYQVHCMGELAGEGGKPIPCGENLIMLTSGR